MAAKGDLSVNFVRALRLFQCGPMQYYVQRMPVSYPIYVKRSIIYGSTKPSLSYAMFHLREYDCVF